MKPLQYISMGLLLTSGLFISCKKTFLDRLPQGSVDAGSLSNWLWGSVAGGDAHKGSDGGDQPSMIPVANFSINPGNDLINDRWKALYEGVTRCNNVLSVLPKVTDIKDPADITNIRAQARFLRGHFYFE